MSIEAIGSELPLNDAYESASLNTPPAWQTIGDRVSYVFSLTAFCVCIPFIGKKRRITLLTAPIAPLIEAPVPAAAEAPAPPDQQIPRFPRASATDAGYVQEIFATIATGNAWHLMKHGWRLKTIGDELRAHNQHPFDFLANAPKEHVQAIFRSNNAIKISGVMAGVKEGMERESARRNLLRYLADFAQTMQKPVPEIQRYLRSQDWEGLVRYIFDVYTVHG